MTAGLALLVIQLQGCGDRTRTSTRDELLVGAWTGYALPCDSEQVARALLVERVEVVAGPAEDRCGPGGWDFGGTYEARLDTCFFEVSEEHPINTDFWLEDGQNDPYRPWVYVGHTSTTVTRLEFLFQPDTMLLQGVVEYDLDGFDELFGSELDPCEHFALTRGGGSDVE